MVVLVVVVVVVVVALVAAVVYCDCLSWWLGGFVDV